MNLKEIDLNEVKIDELKEFLTNARLFMKEKKAEIKEAIKENREAEKAEKVDAGKLAVKAAGIGGTVTVAYKGENLEAKITKINDKTVNLMIDIEGEPTPVWRFYHQVVTD